MKLFTLRNLQAISTIAVCLTLGATQGHADSNFYSTSDASHWQVATNVGGADGSFSSFLTTGFVTATAVTNPVVRTTNGTGWIANNSTGSNSTYIGNWTFFVFRQTFDLTGYDPNTANLMFQWAADDSGQGGGSENVAWTPKYSLNGGPLIDGNWSAPDFSFSTLHFYVCVSSST